MTELALAYIVNLIAWQFWYAMVGAGAWSGWYWFPRILSGRT